MKCDELRIENACVYGPDAKVYLAEQVDHAIDELKDKIQMHDFFWEGCGFAKRGFKNAIAVAQYVEDLEAENERLRGESCKLTDGCLRLKQCRKEKANIADELRHQKRKRCLAMAECRDAQARLFHRFGTEVMLHQLYGRNPAVDMERMDRRSSRCRLASQLWKKRAEEFKEAR